MNRSFRAPESQMQAAFEHMQQQMGGMRSSVMKEKEEELALFLEMKKREKERDDLLLNSSEELDVPLSSKPGTSPLFNITLTPAPALKTGADEFLNSDNDKNDYDWLLTPPGTPLFPSLEMESQKTVTSQLGTAKARPTVLKSRLASPQREPTARDNLVSRWQVSSPGLNSSSGGIRRPSSTRGPGSRPATPTGHSSLSTASRPSRPSTPTSRATLPSTKPTSSGNKATASRPTSAIKPMMTDTKATVPASKGTVPTSKPTVPSRSSPPVSRSSARPSTPTARPTLPPSKSTSWASTPTRRPSTPSSAPMPARGISPTVRSRPWKPSAMPGFSLDAPPNLRTSVPVRPLSATRGRPGALTSRSSSVEPVSNGRPRRQSSSPSRGRASNGIVHASGSSMPAVSRGHSKVNDNISPVLIGSKMVDRVINMRKLAPPKQDDKHSPHGNLSVRSSSSPDSSGFGRTLSKKSLDMAIRHMDIRRTIPGNLRPLMTNIPASSMSSVRSGPPQSRSVGVSDSPLSTSSNASSEVSVNNGLCFDSSEVEDDIGSERGCRSPTSMRGR
ncbi:mucin-17-like isoform X1 [Quillaja saponaria]|uniref:Mucin-17-like isoform X1 n=1 Tax=Quillaja saponaria TaxID=32244 RepID=A0AAD7LK59_QUISA|nr:mucin-17-like isoform X1 [Quillaja saponaria]